MSDYRELLIGCGHARDKRLGKPNEPLAWQDLTTLDAYANCRPDIIWNLNQTPWCCPIPDPVTENGTRNVPMSDNSFDEIHAYEVLEHLGHQGNAIEFFAHFYEIWRLLKPGGFLFATVPSRYSPWAWGDPSHTRVIQQETLVFLDQTQYIKQAGKTSMSDFRHLWKGDFEIYASDDNHVNHIFCLRAVKPIRTHST